MLPIEVNNFTTLYSDKFRVRFTASVHFSLNEVQGNCDRRRRMRQTCVWRAAMTFQTFDVSGLVTMQVVGDVIESCVLSVSEGHHKASISTQNRQ